MSLRHFVLHLKRRLVDEANRHHRQQDTREKFLIIREIFDSIFPLQYQKLHAKRHKIYGRIDPEKKIQLLTELERFYVGTVEIL